MEPSQNSESSLLKIHLRKQRPVCGGGGLLLGIMEAAAKVVGRAGPRQILKEGEEGSKYC